MTIPALTAKPPLTASRIVLHYRRADGARAEVTPDAAALVAFETGRPVRDFPAYPDQKNTPGLYWSATDRRLLAYESYLEATWMTLLDFDPAATAIAAQPFEIRAQGSGAGWKHTPDLFVRRRDGRGRVVDVKNPDELDKPAVVLQAERTRALCEEIGFGYDLVGAPDPVLWRNVRWLAGYRRPMTLPDGLIDRILTLAAAPVGFGDLTEAFDVPELARTAALRACWFGRLTFDLSVPLRDITLIHAAEAS
jgi:hypothetical protein